MFLNGHIPLKLQRYEHRKMYHRVMYVSQPTRNYFLQDDFYHKM